MTSPDISVRPEELITHAGHVDATTDEIAKASDAASTISINHDAFGKLIAFVGGWFQDKEQDLAGKYAQTVTDLRTDAANLRAAAGRYASSDASAANRTSAAGHGGTVELPL